MRVIRGCWDRIHEDMKERIINFIIYILLIPITFFVVPFISKIWYTFLYGKHDFGLFGIVIAIANLLQVFYVLMGTFILYAGIGWVFRKELTVTRQRILLLGIYLVFLVLFTYPSK